MKTEAFRYAAILHHPHHVSDRHPPMSNTGRAAQFGAFKALTGYEDSIEETARYVEKQPELDEDAVSELDAQMRFLKENLSRRPAVRITVFVPDAHKSGGICTLISGNVKKLDEYAKTLTLTSGEKLFWDRICKIEPQL